MKNTLLALSLIAMSSTAFASQVFEDPRITPEGAPPWVNLPIDVMGAHKFCKENGYSSAATYTLGEHYSMYITVDTQGNWVTMFYNYLDPNQANAYRVTNITCA